MQESFKVYIREVLYREVEVDAPTADEALEKVKTQYADQDIVLDASDFVDAKIDFC